MPSKHHLILIPRFLQVGPNNLGLRHWCDQGDNLKRFGWTRHDGETFGDQDIVDGDVAVRTSFVKRGAGGAGRNGTGEWAARIEARLTDAAASRK